MSRRALAWLCCAALALAAVGLAAGRSGGDNGAQASAGEAKSPACANASKAIERPVEVPANLLPPGTVLTSSERLREGETLVSGVISSEFRSAVDFYVSKLPAAGYRNLTGDAEMDEAEANFAGPGVTGKWKVNGILNCSQAVTLTLFVSR